MAQRKGKAAVEAKQPAPVGVMLMLFPKHRDALQDAARRLREKSGGVGRADASRVLRALLDEWIDDGAKLPNATE